MPNMSGVELLRAIRADKKLKNIKVVFLTIARFTGMKELFKLNVLDYLRKPFNNADLIASVKKLIR